MMLETPTSTFGVSSCPACEMAARMASDISMSPRQSSTVISDSRNAATSDAGFVSTTRDTASGFGAEAFKVPSTSKPAAAKRLLRLRPTKPELLATKTFFGGT